MTPLEDLNRQSPGERENLLLGCCGSPAWARLTAAAAPFADAATLHAAADRAFDRLTDDDWREAFDAHPRLGDLDSLRMKFAGNDRWSADEQAGAVGVDDALLDRLAEANAAYEARFGFRFVLCATGVTAAAMLAALEVRLPNPPDEEIRHAATQQRRITKLRIDKLLASTR